VKIDLERFANNLRIESRWNAEGCATPSRPSKVLRVEKGSCAYHYIGSVYGDFLDNCSSGMGPKSNLGNWQSSF
jgi:hypothetical protein